MPPPLIEKGRVRGMNRRRLVASAAVAGGLAALVACGRGSRDGSGGASQGGGTAAPAGTGSAAPTSDPTAVPSRRSAEDVPVVPDSPSRGLTPTTPSGDETTVEGLTVTACRIFVASWRRALRRTKMITYNSTHATSPSAGESPRVVLRYVRTRRILRGDRDEPCGNRPSICA